MHTFISLLTPLVLMVFPFLAYGAVISTPKNFKDLVGIMTDFIGTLIVVVFALTFLTIMWGIIKNWIVKGGETEGVESGKKVVLVGVVALVIMSSIWGLLYLLRSSLFGS